MKTKWNLSDSSPIFLTSKCKIDSANAFQVKLIRHFQFTLIRFYPYLIEYFQNLFKTDGYKQCKLGH